MAKERFPLIDFTGMKKEDAITAIKEKGFANIAKEDIKNYLSLFEAGKSREWLKEAYKDYSKSKLVDVLDESGNKIDTGKKDAKGNPKYKKARVAVEGEKSEKRYNHNIAKTLFFKRLGLETKTKVVKAKKNWEDDFNSFWN